MAEIFRALLMGVGCLATLYIGSCTFLVGSLGVAASRAARDANEAAQTNSSRTPSKWDKASSSTTTAVPAYRDSNYYYNHGYDSYNGGYNSNKIDGKPYYRDNPYAN
jgi:hypothetical protein